MSGETIKRVRFYGVWQEEKEQEWLESMPAQGWHLCEVFPLVYTFCRGEPTDYVYRFDFQTDAGLGEDYFQLYEDAGWEHVGQMGGWRYFRTVAPEGELPEIFTDVDSRIAKYKRVLGYLAIFAAVFMGPVSMFAANDGLPDWYAILMIPLILVYIFAIGRLLAMIKMLERRKL